MSDQRVLFTGSIQAERAIIGAMLIDDRCLPLVLSKTRPEDFTDGTCKATFLALRKLTMEGRPTDPVTLVDVMHGGDTYSGWVREVMELTPTAANVEEYIAIAQRGAALRQLRDLADRLLLAPDLDEAAECVRKMSGLLSASSRMPRMTAAELAQDFLARMSSKEKPEYLPWGLPSADCTVYAELGDMILLGGYPSAGKTLLSIQMALAQAKRYKVGYYTLEADPSKMADRMFCHLSGVPLAKIKTREFGETEWRKLADNANLFVNTCPIEFIRAAGSTVEDITMDAIGHGFQIIYIDYLQKVGAPGFKLTDRYGLVTAVSDQLKIFSQRTNTAVIALAQLRRPDTDGKRKIPPSMDSFRESGQIEQDADAAFLLWPSDPDDNRSSRVLKLAKNKEGNKFRVELAFQGDTQTMVELEEKSDMSVAADLAAKGRHVKESNRRAALAGQTQFQELREGDGDNPFVD